jgi:anthranilate phosphoribosyltransferase
VGWAYIDQKEFCPPLHNLVELRRLIVKRPCLSTLEKLCGPIRAQQRTHLLVGYVHRDYERLLPFLARHAGYTSALVVRGVEGGVVPALNTTAFCVAYTDGGVERQLKLDPKEVGLESTLRAVPFPSDGLMDSDDEEGPTNDTDTLAAASAKAGLAALSGATGPTRDSLVYTGAALLCTLGRFDSLRMAATAVRDALDSGMALKRFQKGS